MWFKKEIQIQVYGLYIDGLTIEVISHYIDMAMDDVNEIIDYVNEIIT